MAVPRITALMILSGLLVSGGLQKNLNAAEWSRFRGPNGSAISEVQGLPDKWDEKTNLAWKSALPGPGSSSPIVWGDRIYITCYTGYGVDFDQPGNRKDLVRHLVCLQLSDGKIVWDRPIPSTVSEDSYSGHLRDHGYATSTPVCDGKRIYVFFGKTGVLAFDLDGKELWRTSVGTGSGRMGWGSAASPVLYKNLVIVNAAAESKALIALDQETGKEVLKSPADSLYGSWSTPVTVTTAAGKTELVISAPYEVWGYNPDNGDFLWFAEGVADQTICGSLVSRDGIVYAIGGRSGSAVAIRAGGKDDITKTNTLWKKSLTAYVPSPVLSGDKIWSVSERGILSCIKAADGASVYSKRLDLGGVYASPIVADGKIYIVSREKGTAVVAADDKGEVLSTNTFDDDTDFNAGPAVVDGKLLLRSNKFLYCVSKSAAK